MRLTRTVLFAAALVLLAGPVAADSYRTLEDKAMADLWSLRGDPAGIVALYRADALRDALDATPAFQESLVKVLGAADSDPEVKAHVANLLALTYRDAGRLDEASRLESGLGFDEAWQVIGPFDDENKVGFEAEYPPEKELRLDASYPGKGHAVSWRKVPPLLQRGLVPLDQLLDPTEKVAGYALSFVKVDRDTPCVLRGAYNEAYKIWVDGEAVADRKVYNGRAFDQYADPCTLRRGWNAILVKVCNQDAGWNFSLRLTDARGTALEGWRASADAAAVDETVAQILKKDGAAPEGYSVNDPGAVLEKRAHDQPTVANLTDYGLYLKYTKSFDRQQNKDAEILRLAAAAKGATPSTWVALGDAEPDHNKRLAAYTAALASDPADPQALERMARYELGRGLPFSALGYLQRARKADPDGLALRVLEDTVRLQFMTDGIGAADLRELYKAHPTCNVVVEAMMDAMRAMGQGEEMERVVEAYRQANQSDTAPWYNRLADLMTTGKTDAALKLYGEMEARFPLDRTVIFRHASYLLSLDRAGEAEALVKKALAWAPDWPEGHQLAGDVEEALGHTDAALQEYQQALILKPQSEDVKRKVTYLKPQEAGFEADYRVDAKDVPTDIGAFGDQQVVVLVDNTVVKVEPNGLSSRYVQKVIQVLNSSAAQQLQYVPIPFDPDRQEVRVLEASILKKDGTKVHADTMVTDALSDPQYRLYYRNRNLVLIFPSLEAGDRLWIEYKVSDVGESNEYGRYFGDLVIFAGSTPVLLKQYTLILPEAFPLYMEASNLDTKPMIVTLRGQKIYRWVVRDLDRMQQEPGMPGVTEVAPYLHVSTFKDWSAMGAWYAKFIADQWELTPEIRQTVKDLIKGCTTDEEKARAIHRWVVQQTHYVGLEFGVHGYRPYKVRQIFERRFGDCKDKALLMTAMMREAGLDACMVLVRTSGNGAIAPTPASLAIFNHAICYVPSLKLFLDGTAEYSGLHELPYQDQGVWVLLVWPDGRTERVQTPVDSPTDNEFSARYRLDVPASGSDAAFKAEVKVKGQECAWMRRRYQDREKLLELLQQDLSSTYPGTRLRDADSGPMADLSRDVSLSYDGTLGGAAMPDGKGRVSLPVWMGRLNLASSYATLQDRQFPLVLNYPWTQSYEVTYVLPPGASADLPAAASMTTDFGGVSRTARREGDRVIVDITISLTRTRIEPDQYPAFRTFCKEADQVADERLRVRLAGGQP